MLGTSAAAVSAQPAATSTPPTNVLAFPTAVTTPTPTSTPSASPTPTGTPTQTQPPTSDATSTPTVTPTPSETIDPRRTHAPLNAVINADVLFPVGVAFHVTYTRPENGVRAVTLTVAQDGWRGETIELDLETIQTDVNGISQFDYVWHAADRPPRLFEPLTLTWTIAPTGRVAQSFEATAMFADARVPAWHVVPVDGMPVTFAAAVSRASASLIGAHLALVGRIVAHGGRTVDPVRVVVFPIGVDPDPCAAGPTIAGAVTTIAVECESAAAAAIYDAQGWTIRSASLSQPLQVLLTDELLRSAYPVLFASDTVPAWFKDGLRAYLAGAFSVNDLETARMAARSGALLHSLDIVPDNDAEAGQLRQQGTGVVLYMAAQVGLFRLLDVLDRLEAGEPLDVVWPSVSGQVLDALIVGWSSWIFTAQAESAYAITPSLDPTRTPIPTATDTATFTPRPTVTPSPSPTLTPTPTASWTPTETPVFEHPTAAPTRPPTETALPTLTPLPAESFTLEVPPDDSGNGLSAFVIVAGVLAAIASLAAVVALVRRR